MNEVVTDQLSDARLRQVLGARPFRYFPQVGSTNDIAREWALEGAPAGAVVITDEQLTGRGRFGRAWSAPPGTALLMSAIIRPRAARIPRLTMVGAVAVGEVLEEIAPGKVSLKWPNDVRLDGRKVCGILPEAIWQGDQFVAVILGLGLNVRIDFKNTDLEQRATSIEAITEIAVDRAVLLDKLMRRIDYWSMRVMERTLLEKWRDWLVTIGSRVTASGETRQITGQAVGVDDDGALLLRTDDGTIHRVIAGEVTLSQ
jgi:BirA family transcriptional regulator, biotin operon repressor / biotin---[acetyl-CoA-carboxylase] ligase